MDDKKKKNHEKEQVEEVTEVKDTAKSSDVPQSGIMEDKQWEDKYKRALADYQNLQRHTQEEKKEWAMFSKAQAVLKFLPILDTLMLAEKHTKDQTFALTVQQFLQVLKEEGFERIETLGKAFDPLIMSPVGTKEGKENIVLEEVQIGFKLGEMIVRPASVIVGKEE